MPDIFEEAIGKKNAQLFEKLLEEKKQKIIFERVDQAIPKLVRQYIRSHHSKQPKPISLKEVLSLVKDQMEKIPVPERVIEKETRVIQKTENKIEKEIIEGLKNEIEELKRKIEENSKLGPLHGYGLRTGKIIPSISQQQGKVLSNTGNKLVWIEQSTSTINPSTDVYTTSNVNTDRSFDATDTSLDEVAAVLGSLIQSLQGTGIIQ